MAKAQRSNHIEEPINRTELVRKPESDLVFYQGQEGTPGVDFPIYSHIPRTAFSCKGVESGYYADLDTDCQVRKTFLCNIFNSVFKETFKTHLLIRTRTFTVSRSLWNRNLF